MSTAVNWLHGFSNSCRGTHLAAQPSPGLADMSPVCELNPMIATRIGAMMVVEGLHE
jgi:hypothetical protein